MSAVSALRPSNGSNRTPFAVVATAHFESGPPASKMPPMMEDGEVVETCQEEAWEERKKKTTTTTKNIERRVQRQLVLEDGRVVEDTGPVITEDTKEESVTKEEKKDEKQRPQGQIEAPPLSSEGWVAIPGAVVISEKETKTINSRDVKTDELETEEVQFCGDVTNQEAEEHVIGKEDLRALIKHRQETGNSLALTQPQKRVVYENTRKKGTKDTVSVREHSKIQDGHVTTETERCVEHENYSNESAPDDGSSLSDGSAHEAKKQTAHNLVHTKDEDLLEYYAVPKGGTLAQGVKLGEGMHVVSEDVHEDRKGDEDKEAAEKVRKVRRPQRRDALTKKPLDYNQEEVVRKKETDRWLEHHFGSESGKSGTSSREESIDGHSSGGNRITITMNPRPASPKDTVDRAQNTSVRRWKERESYTPQFSSKAPEPPPPPPKPGRLWESSPISPQSSLGRNTGRDSGFGNSGSDSGLKNNDSGRVVHDIHESELAAARARLRSTGRSLTDDNKENDEPYKESQRSFSRDPENSYQSGYSTAPIRISRKNRESNVKSESRVTDPVYSSRFRSGQPYYSQKEASPDESPVRISVNDPPSSVGRSQSFNVQTLPWSSRLKEKHSSSYADSTYSNGMLSSPTYSSSKFPQIRSTSREYRSTDRIDNLGYNKHPAYSTDSGVVASDQTKRTKYKTKKDMWEEPNIKIISTSSKKSSSSKKESSPSRRRSPDAKKLIRRLFGSSKDSRHKEASYNHYDGNAREAETQTPVPPPRTKKKKRPKSCYFFGQDSGDGMSCSSMNGYGSPEGRSRDHSFSESTYTEHTRNERYLNRSPKEERRYRTTMTVNTFPSSSRQTSGLDSDRRNYLYSTTKSSWTNTVDPRRRTRIASEEERPTTLPRPLNSSYSSPRRTYIFGQDSPSEYDKYDADYRDTSVNRDTSEKRFMSLNERVNSHLTKPVNRSQSFNVQAGQGQFKKRDYLSPQGRPLSSTFHRDSQHQSSPYINLQSPNLIAHIARSSSIRTDSREELEPQKETSADQKRESFLRGLRHDAPELFNFIHGDESKQESQNTESRMETTTFTKTQQMSPQPTTPTQYSAKVYTFGRSDNNTLTRSSSSDPPYSRYSTTDEMSNKRSSAMHDKTTSIMNRQNISMNDSGAASPSSQRHYATYNGSPRKSTFNMKTPGSSLLFSPSFREKREDDRRLSEARKRLSGDYTGGTFQRSQKEGSPVIIPVRDWDMR